MPRIEVEESALEAIKAMAQQLRDERDELLAALTWLMDAENRGRIMPFGDAWDAARAAVAKCTSSPKVME